MGQLLEYTERYLGRGDDVQPVLYVQHEPSDKHWERICARYGAILAWPEVRERILGKRAARTGSSVAAPL